MKDGYKQALDFSPSLYITFGQILSFLTTATGRHVQIHVI